MRWACFRWAHPCAELKKELLAARKQALEQSVAKKASEESGNPVEAGAVDYAAVVNQLAGVGPRCTLGGSGGW